MIPIITGCTLYLQYITPLTQYVSDPHNRRLLDPDPHLSMRIQEVTSSELKIKIAAKYKSEKEKNI